MSQIDLNILVLKRTLEVNSADGNMMETLKTGRSVSLNIYFFF